MHYIYLYIYKIKTRTSEKNQNKDISMITAIWTLGALSFYCCSANFIYSYKLITLDHPNYDDCMTMRCNAVY